MFLFRVLVLDFSDSYYFTAFTFIRTLLLAWLATLFSVGHIMVIEDSRNADWLIQSLHGTLQGMPVPQKSSQNSTR